MTTAVGSGIRAGLGMYPFDEVRWAFDAIWSAVHERMPGTPVSLNWSADLHDSWLDPDFVVSQTCGWPLVTELDDRVRVVGAFAPPVPNADGPRYRSVLVAREQRPLASFVDDRAAVNSLVSLSGWVSLVHAVHGPGAWWHGEMVMTGAHVESLRAVRDAAADIASIDAVSFELARRHRPELVEGIVVVGAGPLVPCLPVITPASTSDGTLAALRDALRHAVEAQPEAAAAAVISSFEPLDAADYHWLRDLAPAR